MLRGDESGSNARMIRDQIVARGIRDRRVIEAFQSVPRERFVPPHLSGAAYEDNPLPLQCGQTISQPFIVAFMTELLRLQPTDSVLEIGTGSGYQTAILARLARVVYSAELEPDLARGAEMKLGDLGITNVVFRTGDGLEAFRDQAPFDAILSAAAPARIPDALIEQLAGDGRCVIPAGLQDMQYLYLIEKRGGEVRRTRLDPVRFVPLRVSSP